MLQWKEREQINSPGSPARSRGLIYVVDDEVMLLELATIILEPRGYTVRSFRDPASALEAFIAAQPRPALVITDYAMHNMNGMALIAACRRVEPDQKILLISGTVSEDIYQDSPCKPDAFVAKPYHAKQLIEKVESMIAS
jgi:DNA-binding NtrC family response regulator